eukprot:Rhum_TRINITY_DN14851_c6_g2::Rhum_TRINITY_DN14851_c6_g2_i1::g.122956::m.122956
MDAYCALTEFVLDGDVYFLDQRFDANKVELLLVSAADLTCFQGSALLRDLRIHGFKRGEYVQLLKRALRTQDVREHAFRYGLVRDARGATFEVRVKVSSSALPSSSTAAGAASDGGG